MQCVASFPGSHSAAPLSPQSSSLVPSPCAFVACSTKIQRTRKPWARSLGTRPSKNRFFEGLVPRLLGTSLQPVPRNGHTYLCFRLGSSRPHHCSVAVDVDVLVLRRSTGCISNGQTHSCLEPTQGGLHSQKGDSRRPL